MEDNAPDELHIIVTLTDGPPGCLANSGKGFGQKLVERSAVLKPSLKLIGLGTKLSIAELLKTGLQLIYPVHYRLQVL